MSRRTRGPMNMQRNWLLRHGNQIGMLESVCVGSAKVKFHGVVALKRQLIWPPTMVSTAFHIWPIIDRFD